MCESSEGFTFDVHEMLLESVSETKPHIKKSFFTLQKKRKEGGENIVAKHKNRDILVFILACDLSLFLNLYPSLCQLYYVI